MRLLRLHACDACGKQKSAKFVIDTSDGELSVPLCCPSCPWANGHNEEDVCRVPDSRAAEIVGKLCIELYRTGAPVQVPACGQFDIVNFESQEVKSGIRRYKVSFAGRKYPGFKVEFSWEPNPIVDTRLDVEIHAPTIPHLAWEAIDVISSNGHTRTQRGQNSQSNWVYLEGYASNYISNGAMHFRTRAVVSWPKQEKSTVNSQSVEPKLFPDGNKVIVRRYISGSNPAYEPISLPFFVQTESPEADEPQFAGLFVRRIIGVPECGPRGKMTTYETEVWDPVFA
jgi:hypothetical protein